MFGVLYTPDGPVGYHLQTAKRGRVVPGNLRHSWLIKKLLRGQSTTCQKCGCKRTLTRSYDTYYQMPGQKETMTRPDCPSK